MRLRLTVSDEIDRQSRMRLIVRDLILRWTESGMRLRVRDEIEIDSQG